ncbi:hypothetical protein [Saccharothrix syringae]|uniref:hypothetical protein n=1 Tax=Saccharothrix syringae TaxID=103733 RepID=UPI000B0C508A|nr:hypothetical protein [Saccharothrix syringae]
MKLDDDAHARNAIASTFGLAGDLPGVVTTGCGLRVPRAMTSPLPERVTCLPCRDHARELHLRRAEQVERLSTAPGSAVAPTEARAVAAWHRGQAERFSGTDG